MGKTVDKKSATEIVKRLEDIKYLGYATFPNFSACFKAIDFLLANGIRIGRNTEYYADTMCVKYIIEPNKTNKQKILDLLQRV